MKKKNVADKYKSASFAEQIFQRLVHAATFIKAKAKLLSDLIVCCLNWIVWIKSVLFKIYYLTWASYQCEFLVCFKGEIEYI